MSSSPISNSVKPTKPKISRTKEPVAMKPAAMKPIEAPVIALQPESASEAGEPHKSSQETMHHQPTINIGMIGHVAHGKSTITRCLSGTTTARFRKEKEANMTIRLGYASVKIFECTNSLCPKPWRFQPGSSDSDKSGPPKCRRPNCGHPSRLVRHISLVDAPGHHSLMATMVAGASVLDGAMLVVAADERCPCPQTTEHLAAAEVLGVSRNLIVLQNKVDICTMQRCAESLFEIRQFLGDQKTPVIPTAAMMGANIDVLCQYLVEKIPLPIRDLESPARMSLVRSFDVNKPGRDVEGMLGGVVGGTVTRGVLSVGDEIEIRPGALIRLSKPAAAAGSGPAAISFRPLKARVLSLRFEQTEVRSAQPGGLVAVGLTLDPALSRADLLVGNVLGKAGTLPPVFTSLTLKYTLMRETDAPTATLDKRSDAIASIFTAAAHTPAQRSTKDRERPKKGETLQLCIGPARVTATVVAADERKSKSKKEKEKEKEPGKKERPRLELQLYQPVCADVGEKVVMFRMEGGRWRLLAAASIHSLVPLDPPVFSSTTHTLADDVSLNPSDEHWDLSDDKKTDKDGPEAEVEAVGQEMEGADDEEEIEVKEREGHEQSPKKKSATAKRTDKRTDKRADDRTDTDEKAATDIATDQPSGVEATFDKHAERAKRKQEKKEKKEQAKVKHVQFDEAIKKKEQEKEQALALQAQDPEAELKRAEEQKLKQEKRRLRKLQEKAGVVSDPPTAGPPVAEEDQGVGVGVERMDGLSRFLLREEEWPSVGDLVIAKITRIDPEVGAYCQLLDFNGKEGLLPTMEMTRKRVKSIRQLVYVGTQEVCLVLRVDPKKGFVDLSRMRVDPSERSRHNTWFKLSLQLQTLLARVSARTRVSMKDLWVLVVSPLQAMAQDLAEQEMNKAVEAAVSSWLEESATPAKEEPKDVLHGVDVLQMAARELDQTGKSPLLEQLATTISALSTSPALSAPVGPKQCAAIMSELSAAVLLRLQPKPKKFAATMHVSCLGAEGIFTVKEAISQGLASTIKQLFPTTDAASAKSIPEPPKSLPENPKKRPDKSKKRPDDARSLTVTVEASPSYAISVMAMDPKEANNAISTLIRGIQEALAGKNGTVFLSSAVAAQEPKAHA